MIDIQEPPAQYQGYGGPLVLVELPYQRMKTMCFVLGARWKGGLYGCAKPSIGNCLVVIPEIGPIVDAARHARVLEHELAHCNNWQH